MQIAKLAPVDVGVVRWRTDRQHTTVVVKATFALDGDGPMGLAKTPVPLDPGPPHGGAFSDFVPDKVGVDIVLQGAAHAAVASYKIPFSFRVGHLVRALVAVAEQPARAIPLVDGNLLAADAPGALPASVSARTVRNELWQHAALAETFDYTRFNASPPAQRIEQLAPGTAIVLKNLLAATPLRRIWAPSVQPCLFFADGHHARNIERVPLRSDTLVIDTESLWCSICWRGRLRAAQGDEGEHLIASLESTDTPLQWADVRDSISSAKWEAACEVSDWTPADTTRRIPDKKEQDDDEATQVRSSDPEVTAPEERVMVTAPIALSLKPQSLPFRAPKASPAAPRQPIPTVPEFPVFAAGQTRELADGGTLEVADGATLEVVTAPADRFTTKVLGDAPLAGAALPFRAAQPPTDAHPIAPAPALPPLHLQFAAALDDSADEPLVDPQDRLSGTKPYEQRGAPAEPLPFAPAPEGKAAPPGSALAALPPRDKQPRVTQLIEPAAGEEALPFGAQQPPAQQPPAQQPPAQQPPEGEMPRRSPATRPAAREVPPLVAAPAPLGAAAATAPAAILAHDPLAEDGPAAATPEAKQDALAGAAPAPARPQREDIAKLRAAAAAAVEGDGSQLSVEVYARLRAEVEESADAAATLAELLISREHWAAWRRSWSRRCLRDRALARRFTTELARARKAIRSAALE